MSVNLSLAKPGDVFLTFGGQFLVFRHRKSPGTRYPFVLYDPVLHCTSSYTPDGFYWGSTPDEKDLQCKVRLKPELQYLTPYLETIPCPQQPNT